MKAGGNLNIGSIIDDGSGVLEGTKSSSSADVDIGIDPVNDGSGGADGSKSSPSADVEDGGNLYNGMVMADGSGAADGTESKSADVDVAGNLYSGTVIDDGSGAEEGTKSSTPSNSVKAAGSDTGNVDVGWRSRQYSLCSDLRFSCSSFFSSDTSDSPPSYPLS